MLNLIRQLTSSSSFVAIKNASWMISEKVLTMAMILGVNIVLARHLGAEKFGVLNFLLALIALLTPLTSLGLNAIVTRELVKGDLSQTEIMSTALFYRFLGGVAGIFLILLLIFLGPIELLNQWRSHAVILAAVNLVTALHVIDFYFQAKVLSKYVVKARFVVLALMTLLKLVLVYFDAPLSWFIYTAAIEVFFIACGFFCVYYLKSGRFRIDQVRIGYGLKLLKQSFWLILSGIASILYLKIDQVMLGEMVSASEVGVYAVASRMSEVWYFFPVAIVSSFFPVLLKSKESSSVNYSNKLQKLCDLLFALGFALAIIISFIATPLIEFLFGEQYQAAGPILSVHIWAGVFVFMRALLSKWLIAEQLLSFSLLTHGIGAVINIGLNFWLIPIHQSLGAAIATIVSYAFASYLVLFFHKSTYPMAIIMTRAIFLSSRSLFYKVKSAS